MQDLIKSFQQLFTQPTFIKGVSLGHLVALILAILVVIGLIITVRMIGQITGCVMRFGCLLVGLFMLSAITVVLLLTNAPH